ncbi:alpha-L-arabinofuranosidase C-terminal domain-containing protein [Rhizobium leguminosarum]|uniref:alpha-L-arabinofuranosidase C-terminal domain-containing protein n=1 Tax=Rhizobium leguminosarum TaxID=384 RepID=UPI001427E428|nr:alpha-L-arabinofuranosidase C-terminal domain-containing protein [Rhizobium leguminosarum]
MTGGFAQVRASKQQESRRWNPMILGHFVEHFHNQIYGGVFDPGSHLADDRGFRLDVIEALKELRPPIVRWPGGNFVSDYHWYEAVGANRLPSYNKAWRVAEPNTFGTDEFIEWCRRLNCEPYICTNAGSGTPEEMSNWLEYCNGHLETRYANLRRKSGYERPHAVKYWGIGNESYADFQIGAKTIGEWGPYVAEAAKMMRSVDDTIVLSAAAVPDTEWTLNLLKHAGRYLDLVSIHGYWDDLEHHDEPSDYLTAVLRSHEPEKMIDGAREIIALAGLEGQIQIAFDEWNLRGWHHPRGTHEEKIRARDRNDRAETYTMADALFTASFLNSCLRNSDIVSMANVSPSINARGPLYVHGGGVVRRSTFYVLKAYNDHLKPWIGSTSVNGPTLRHAGAEIATIEALTSSDGASRNLFIVNRDPHDAILCELYFDNHRLDGDRVVTVISGLTADSFNTVEAPDMVSPRAQPLVRQGGGYYIPPHSLCVLEVPG